jgi:DNA helicase IV
MLYARLDELRRETAARLSRVWREPTAGTHQARSERDSSAALHSDRLAQVNAVEGGLCFGRLDLVDGERLYIGRLGIFDEDNDYEPLLVDWRAGAARPFYCATAASPDGVTRRRHIHTKGRTVIGFDDDVFDLESLSDAERGSLNGEAALMAALNASRTGRMRDIVATIQAEQDNVIRADSTGVLVVQGGPGTGKTAVALHRAGYLLYNQRATLSRRGVLIVGPNPTFLRYIDQVLPSLGETDALLRTVGQLYPGLDADGVEPADVAEVKGRAGMASVIAAAVADRQVVPSSPIELVVEGVTVTLDAATCGPAREAARRSRLPHNQARRVFERAVLARLVRQAADALRAIVPAYEEIPLAEGEDPFGELFSAGDLADLRMELAGSEVLRSTLDELWPRLSPFELLGDLYASDSRLAAAGLGPAEAALLARPAGSAWTPADVPLLDEAAELLGPTEDVSRAERAAMELWEQELEYAAGVMEILETQDTATKEILHASDVVDARHLAARFEERPDGTTAERAAADRTWTFGHVIVDEAQELSEMAWRVLMRRCPTRSMTIVGDVAQTGSLAGSTSWARVLEPYVGSRWRLAELTVNYRTPSEVMEVAADVLAAVDPQAAPPTSVRSAGVRPWCRRVAASALVGEVSAAAADELAALGEGRLAVIAPPALVAELDAALVEGGAGSGGTPGVDLERAVVVLTVERCKGLEFDSVIIVEPASIADGSPRGGRDLYVALTRTTRRLGVVHALDLPPVLGRLD